jgi:predicted RNA-binding Zn ribbon-like protein
MLAAQGHGQSDVEIGQAPGQLARLQAFVNTLDIEQRTDELATPAALDTWLRREGLSEGPGAGAAAAAGEPAGPADLALALALRETLRAVLRAHVTHRSARATPTATASDRDSGPAERLAEIAAGLHARITSDADGAVRVLPAESGSRAALGRLLLIAAEAATIGTWERLKVCSADDCQWAFYDQSPTRSGCWCSMQVCGSRAKSRAYRSRQARAS